MQISKFISVGENIHCTRIYKVGGKYVKEGDDGTWAIHYQAGDGPRQLPVPPAFTANADWESGKVKHCAVAIWQGTRGDEAGKAAGIDYLQNLAKVQEAAGATYLDINVDEFSTDVQERVDLIQWTVKTVQPVVVTAWCSIPASIKSVSSSILASCATSHSKNPPST